MTDHSAKPNKQPDRSLIKVLNPLNAGAEVRCLASNVHGPENSRMWGRAQNTVAHSDTPDPATNTSWSPSSGTGARLTPPFRRRAPYLGTLPRKPRRYLRRRQSTAGVASEKRREPLVSRAWYHYTCLHSNCPLNIVLLQQHVFIISEHHNGSNIILTRLMAQPRFVRVCAIRAGPLMACPFPSQSPKHTATTTKHVVRVSCRPPSPAALGSIDSWQKHLSCKDHKRRVQRDLAAAAALSPQTPVTFRPREEGKKTQLQQLIRNLRESQSTQRANLCGPMLGGSERT